MDSDPRLQDARDECKSIGPEWDIAKETAGSLVCTKDGLHWNDSCNSCETWRLLVFESGSDEHGLGSISTEADAFYGGHSPCENGDNFQHCGQWPQGFIAVFVINNLKMIKFN